MFQELSHVKRMVQFPRRQSRTSDCILSILLMAFVTIQHRNGVLSLSVSSKKSSRTNSVSLNVAIVPMLDDEFGDEKDRSLNKYMKEIQQLKPLWIDEQYFLDLDRVDTETELSIQQKQEVIRSRMFTSASVQPGSYRVQIPLAMSTTANVLFGMSVAEVAPGLVISQSRLNLDTMLTEHVDDDDAAKNSWLQSLDAQFCGLVVTSVLPDSPIAKAGVQVGDIVTAISATMGGNVWPTSTLQGIRSALSSRKITSGSVTLELQRPNVAEGKASSLRTLDDTTTAASMIVTSDAQYELKLTRPLGFQIGETSDGYVVVTEIHPTGASNLVRYAVAVGDRIVAVDSSFGDTLWPVSTVEGVVSAVTSRLPGQSVTFRFERPKNVKEASSENKLLQPEFVTKASSSVDIAFPESKNLAATIDTSVPTISPLLSQKDLIQRCRDVLRRYSGKQQDDISVTRSVLASSPSVVENRRSVAAVYQLNALVADKVVDALASASVMIDSITLSMIMNTYLQCQKPLSAIRIFEAATGFSGDGSTNPAVGASTIVGKTGGRIAPSESSLNLYTGTALLQAHAALGDYRSVARVFAALEGRSGILDKYDSSVDVGKQNEIMESAPWPWTGAYGSIQPDTVCYNIAIAAAEKIGGKEALNMALELFDQMCDPPVIANTMNKKSSVTSSNESERPLRNEITYNTMMSVLCNMGQGDRAFKLLSQMQKVGLRPDKYTYTVLIKACDKEDDVQELLYAMRERGIQSDVVTYNTIIKLLCSKRLLTKATKIVTEMESRGIAPDSRTYGTLMSGLLDAGKANSCLALFESAYANIRTVALTENVQLYTTAITAASVLGNHERALDLVTRMTACGVKPTLQTLTAVMGACLAAGKPKLAAQLYRRIESPDGYAMYQGIQAFRESGDLDQAAETLASQRRGSRLLSGQQMMRSYQGLLGEAVERKAYSVAQNVFVDLLEKGYIPSKAILSSIFESMNLQEQGKSEDAVEAETAKFRFLLFMLDALQARNLPVESCLYINALSSGAQLGGLPRKVASLLARAKTSESKADENRLYAVSSDATFSDESRVISGWVDLLDKYECLPKESMLLSQLPRLPVRVATRDMARVLRAEQSVTYSNRRNKQSGILKR